MTDGHDFVELRNRMRARERAEHPISYAQDAGDAATAIDELIARLRAAEVKIVALRRTLGEARKWIAGQPDTATSIFDTSFRMIDEIDAVMEERP